MKAKPTEPSLFDELVPEIPYRETLAGMLDVQDRCLHKDELKTLTIWTGEKDERMTWTCESCGRIRGRC